MKRQTPKPDTLLTLAIFLLVIFGVIMVTNASAPEAQRVFGDKFFFAKQQLLWATLGILGFIFASFVKYTLWQRLALPLFLASLVFLILVLIPGIGIQALGARRWLEAGPIIFQPSEFAKLTLVFYISSLLGRDKSRLLAFLIATSLAVGFVVLEPDLGTAIVIAGTALAVYFASGASLFYLLFILPIVLLLGLLFIIISAYRRERLLTFLGSGDPLGSSYHIRQVLLALGSGGLFGVGLGQSRQKYLFLPEATTDSIFAVIAEELGFFGATALILLFGFILARMLKIARGAPDEFSQLAATGIASWIGIQAVINLAGMVVLVPLTGVPLPFISYGGSSLFAALFGAGIVVNISKHQVLKK